MPFWSLAVLEAGELLQLLPGVDALAQADVIDLDGVDSDLVHRQHRRVVALLELGITALPLAPTLYVGGGATSLQCIEDPALLMT